MVNFTDEPVSVQITRMRALSGLDPFGGDADFRSEVTIGEQFFSGRTFRNDDDISPGNDWNFTTSGIGPSIPITIAIFDDDGFSNDDRVDINPAGGSDLNLFVSLTDGVIFDQENGNPILGNVGELITVSGRSNDRGQITFRIDAVGGPESDRSTFIQGFGLDETPETFDRLGRDNFGNSPLVTGDFDRDGRDDLVVDVSGERPNPITHVLYGSSSGLSRADTQNFTRTRNNNFLDASALAVGDVDGNGVDDLIIGGPNPVLRRGFAGFGLSGFQTIQQAPAYPSNLGFGGVLAAGDFNGDGRDDVATSALSTGAVQINYGSNVGIRNNNGSRQVFTRDTPGIAGTAESSFGEALAAGDVNGDGFDDLIIGVPNSIDIERSGTFHVLYGRSSGLSALNAQLIGQFFGGINDQAGDRFGGRVAVGDVNGDNVDDVVVAATGRNSGAGAVYVYEGRQGQSLPFTNPKILTKSSLFGGASLPGDAFGTSLAVKDINNDGFDEIIIGATGSNNGADNNTGTVHVTFGSSIGPTSTVRLYRQGIDGVAGTPEAFDLFGSGVAVGNFDGVGAAEVAVSIPFEDIGGIRDAGMINVIADPLSNASASLATTQSTWFGTEGYIRTLAEWGDDIVAASSGDDRLVLGAEANAIVGLDGDDLIAGGLGNDFIEGGDGDDILRGDHNSRQKQSQRPGGDDVIYGGGGNDRIGGKSGNDRLDGGTGNDSLWGDAGDDVIGGGSGNDQLTGGAGNDQLIGGAGDDTLIGVDPDSRHPGAGEFDQMAGGAGRDRFVLGDHQHTYYLGDGLIDRAMIFDFSFSDRDVIQLHGEAADYRLGSFSEPDIAGVTIATSDTGDVVGSVVGLSLAELSLGNTAVFEFVS